MKIELYFERNRDGTPVVSNGVESGETVVVPNVERVIVTYNNFTRVHFKSIGDKCVAEDQTYWSEWEEDALTMQFEGNMVVYGGTRYFADWSIEEGDE
jgi:hypothetical protein